VAHSEIPAERFNLRRGPAPLPALSSTNGAAEHSVRPVVCQRKISGRTRSPEGTHTFTTLATLFGTWRARGLDPLAACRSLSPRRQSE
jgi:hypothetical protein